MNFTIKEFISLRDFIYQRTGLFYEEKKIFFIKKRLIERMKKTEATSPLDYLRFLKFSDPNGIEFQEFVNLITTNETYFFREFDQLACFAEDCLPDVISRKPAFGFRNLKIWCAACSSGEEAYTLAIIMKAMLLEEETDWHCRILATDIDQNILARAEAGVYDERSVKDMPDEYLQKYMKASPRGYRVAPAVKELVTFEHLNFMDRAAMRGMRDFDFIFCRNALIYFDDISRKEVVNHFYNALTPKGFIYLGHAESMGRISTKFKLRRYGKNMVYQK